MKKIRILILLAVMVCSACAVLACSGPQLKRPLNVKIDDAYSRLQWVAVSGARNGYEVEITQDNKKPSVEKSRTNVYVISALEPEHTYSFRVRAVGDGVNNSSSNWTEPLVIEKVRENGLQYVKKNNNTEYSLIALGTAEGDIEIPAIFRGLPVTEIGKSAFLNANVMTSLIIPDTVTTIGDRAFVGCSSLKSITIPDSVTSIGSSAFSACRSLTSVKLSANLTEIKDNTFENCTALESIDFGGATKVGKAAFSGCTALTSLVIPDQVTELDENVFNKCTGITSLKIGKNLTYINASSFEGCTNLETIEFAADGKLENIGPRAFLGCTKLTELNLPNSLKRIRSEAFRNCVGLATADKIHFSSNLERIGVSAFTGTTYWLTEFAKNTDAIYLHNWLLQVVNFDPANETFTVNEGTVGVAEYAFYLNKEILTVDENSQTGYKEIEKKIRTLTLPNSVKYFNPHAAQSLSSLVTVNFSPNITIIDEYSFADCALLQEFKNIEGVTEIGNWAFIESTRFGEPINSNNNNDKFIKLGLTDKVTKIGTQAFLNTYFYSEASIIVTVDNWVVACKSKDLQDYDIGQLNDATRSIVGIGMYAFYNISKLKTMILPNTVKYINEGAFYGCEGLQDISIPDGVTVIDVEAFSKCAALKTITLPDSVTEIRKSAFYGCSNVTNVINAKNVTSVGENAFYQCGAFTVEMEDGSVVESEFDIELGDKLAYIGARAFYNSAIKDITIPSAVPAIEQYTFRLATSLKSVVIENGEDGTMASIGNNAFEGCTGLTSVTIPSSVKSLGNYAFKDCTEITSVTIEEGLEEIGNSAFAGLTNLTSINLPSSLKSISTLAFRGDIALTSVYVKKTISDMSSHVFFGCSNLTIYTDAAPNQEGWVSNWNSSRRPVLFGCVLADNSYVTSFTKTEDSFINDYSRYIIEAPTREGYNFGGWARSAGSTESEYTADSLRTANDGITVYAIWIEK